VTVPTELHVPVGRPVTIELVSRDVIHSFWVPKLHGKVDLVPGMTNVVHLQADRPGLYSGQCAEYCGMQHAQMRIQVVAQSPAAWRAWLDAQRAPAAEPKSELARHGRDVFMQGACPLCHTVRGTPALGSVGPDLTHLASRDRIAGGALENDVANLSAWVTHAQSLKSGVAMPNLTQFTCEQLNALVEYLKGLK
jgi:cytochrome c oxidase subunit 2